MLQTLNDIRSDVADLRTSVQKIEVTLAERRGERRVGVWLLCTGSAAAATVLSGAIAVFAKWIKFV